MKVEFKFEPYQNVRIIPLLAPARILRCIKEGGRLNIYNVCYYINSETKFNEFYEDELEAVE